MSLAQLLLLLLLHQFTAYARPLPASVAGEPGVTALRSADPGPPAQVRGEPRLRLSMERQDLRAQPPLPVPDRTPAPIVAPPLHVHAFQQFETAALPLSIRSQSRNGRSPPA